MNINMLMQQAQRMQKEVESNIKKAKEELAQTEVHAEAGGGLVKVTMTCFVCELMPSSISFRINER